MALLVVVGLMVLSGAAAMSMHQSCDTDGDCTAPDTYCYQSRKCVNCTDCRLYNRYPGTACAKDKNQCGNCLPGMDPENNLDGTFSCHPSGTLTPSTQAPEPEAPNDNFSVLIIAAIVFVSLLFVSCVIACFACDRSTNSCVTIRNTFSILSDSLMNRGECRKYPPPYSETEGPTAPPESPALPSPLVYQQVCRPVENEPNQRANAYSNPQYVQGGNLGTNPNPEPAETEDENDSLLNSPISQPVDEETQPSHWTPTPGSETSSIIGPTSFTGALQHLSISEPDNSVALQGPSSRPNSDPNIDFDTQSQQGNSENNSERNLSLYITNVININPTVSK